MPAAAVAVSPWTDLEMTGESLRTRAAAERMITPDGMREAAAWYLAGQDPRHPYASPLQADLRGLPPTLIHTGDAEILLDDSTRFAASARAAGVDVTLEVWDDMPHCWHIRADIQAHLSDPELTPSTIAARSPFATRTSSSRTSRRPSRPGSANSASSRLAGTSPTLRYVTSPFTSSPPDGVRARQPVQPRLPRRLRLPSQRMQAGASRVVLPRQR